MRKAEARPGMQVVDVCIDKTGQDRTVADGSTKCERWVRLANCTWKPAATSTH